MAVYLKVIAIVRSLYSIRFLWGNPLTSLYESIRSKTPSLTVEIVLSVRYTYCQLVCRKSRMLSLVVNCVRYQCRYCNRNAEKFGWYTYCSCKAVNFGCNAEKMRLPSPLRTVVVLGRYHDAKNQGARPSARRCFLILSFTVKNTVPGTHIILYCVLLVPARDPNADSLHFLVL